MEKALSAPTVLVIAEGWDSQSALGWHTETLLTALAERGWQASVDLQSERGVPSAWRGRLRPPSPSPALTILQYPIWFPLAESFRRAPGTAVFWYHGVTPPELWSGDDRDVLRRSVAGAELVWNAHLAICDSPFSAAELHRYTGYPSDRTRVVPLGIDGARWAVPPPAAQLDRLRKQWRVAGRRVLLYIGRIAGNKRVDLLITALARLREQQRNVHLLIAGDAESLPAYRDLAVKLREQAEALGVADRVTFAGRVDDLRTCYHLADVFVTASVHEGFGVPLVEAMAAGVPVVASASGALPWLLDADDSPNESGIVFPEGNADALASAIGQLLDDGALREQLIARGRARADAFSVQAFTKATLAALAEVEELATAGPLPARPVAVAPWGAAAALYERADVALRDYRVRSNVPLVGPLLAWFRRNSTTHVKEAYLDRIVEQQVLFNRELVAEIGRLRGEIEALRAELEQKNHKSETDQP